MQIKKGDTIVMLSGDDKGKTGVVSVAFPREGKIVVEGINIVKKHQKPKAEGQKGQVVEIAMPFWASKARKADAKTAKKK